MRRNPPDILGALKWASGFPNAETRGRRVTALAVAALGRGSFDGVTSIRAVADLTGMDEATLYRLLAELEAAFGIIEPGKIVHTKTWREDFSDETRAGRETYDAGEEESESRDALSDT